MPSIRLPAGDPAGSAPAHRGPGGRLARLVLPAVVLAAALAMAWTVDGHPVGGPVLLGAVFLAAAGGRAVLPTRSVGLLAVRGRWWDVLVLSVLGVALLLLALSLRSTYR